jgi:hypothetical protein
MFVQRLDVRPAHNPDREEVPAMSTLRDGCAEHACGSRALQMEDARLSAPFEPAGPSFAQVSSP